MSFQPIDIATVNMGGVREAVNAAIQTVAVDVHERQEIETARTVTLKITLTPDVRPTTDGPRNRPKFAYVIEHKIPPVQGCSTTFVDVGRDGSITLLANANLPESEDLEGQEDLIDD